MGTATKRPDLINAIKLYKAHYNWFVLKIQIKVNGIHPIIDELLTIKANEIEAVI